MQHGLTLWLLSKSAPRGAKPKSEHNKSEAKKRDQEEETSIKATKLTRRKPDETHSTPPNQHEDRERSRASLDVLAEFETEAKGRLPQRSHRSTHLRKPTDFEIVKWPI